MCNVTPAPWPQGKGPAVARLMAGPSCSGRTTYPEPVGCPCNGGHKSLFLSFFALSCCLSHSVCVQTARLGAQCMTGHSPSFQPAAHSCPPWWMGRWASQDPQHVTMSIGVSCSMLAMGVLFPSRAPSSYSPDLVAHQAAPSCLPSPTPTLQGPASRAPFGVQPPPTGCGPPAMPTSPG